MPIAQKQIRDLSFDPENPRLPGFVERTPDSILDFLTDSSAIDELIDAIGENGYFDDEPLIGVDQDGEIIIVEGNRRLAALKLLSRFANASDDEIDAEDLPAKVRGSLKQAKVHPDSVPVAIHETRAEVLVYLGNKHIAGVKPWGALAKARYVRTLMELPQFADADFSQRVRDVARSIGSRSDYIVRALRALQAYDEALATDYFGLDGLTEDRVKFSRLSSALDYSNIMTFVTGEEAPAFPVRYAPNELKELLKWLFVENEDGGTYLGDTRNLRMLSEIVSQPEALEEVRRGKSLTAAYKVTGSLSDDFDKLLSEILANLQAANAIVAEIDASEPRLNDVGAIYRQARGLRNNLESD